MFSAHRKLTCIDMNNERLRAPPRQRGWPNAGYIQGVSRQGFQGSHAEEGQRGLSRSHFAASWFWKAPRAWNPAASDCGSSKGAVQKVSRWGEGLGRRPDPLVRGQSEYASQPHSCSELRVSCTHAPTLTFRDAGMLLPVVLSRSADFVPKGGKSVASTELVSLHFLSQPLNLDWPYNPAEAGSAAASSEYLAALCPSETCNEMSHPLLDFDQELPDCCMPP